MKKSTIVLAALSCAGIAQVGLYQMGTAQPTQPSYSQALALSKKDLKGKNYVAAQRHAQQLLALAKSPEETGKATVMLAESFYRLKMYEQARVHWNTLLNLSGTEDDNGFHVIAHLGVARSYTAQGIVDKAIPEYKAVVDSIAQEGDKSAISAFPLALANSYYKAQQYDLAQRQLNQVIASSQDNPPLLLVALVRDGQINFIQRRFQKSLAEFQQVLDILDSRHFKEAASTSDLKTYIQRQIVALNGLIAAQLGEGQIHSKVGFRVERDTEFDGKIDAFIQMFMDDVVVNDAIIETLLS